MECYKEYPRSISMLTALAAVVYLMAGSALILWRRRQGVETLDQAATHESHE